MEKKLLRAEVASLKRQAADQVANLQMQQQEDDKVSQQLPSQEADHTDPHSACHAILIAGTCTDLVTCSLRMSPSYRLS